MLISTRISASNRKISDESLNNSLAHCFLTPSRAAEDPITFQLNPTVQEELILTVGEGLPKTLQVCMRALRGLSAASGNIERTSAATNKDRMPENVPSILY